MWLILARHSAITTVFGNTFRPIEDSFPLTASIEGELPMAASSIAAFWAIAFLLVIVPGPDWAFTVSAGLRGRSVLPAVGGIVLGYAAMTIVVAAGVGALVARTPAFLSGHREGRSGHRGSRPGHHGGHPGPHRPGHARQGHRRQRPEPQGPAAFPR